MAGCGERVRQLTTPARNTRGTGCDTRVPALPPETTRASGRTGVPVPKTPDDRRRRALLILLLLAREAALAPEQVVGPEARAPAGRGLTRAALAHRASAGVPGVRRWMCRREWTA